MFLWYNEIGDSMEKYLNDWIKVIEGIKNDNTYKASWGKAIIECVLKKEYQIIDGEIIIEEYFLVQKLLKYYWNLNVYFDVNQGDYLFVEKLVTQIQNRLSKKRNYSEMWYTDVEGYLKGHQLWFERQISKLIATVNKNVAHRFLNVGRRKVKLYVLDLHNKQIRFSEEQVDLIRKYSVLLNELINYKWIMFLENFNETKHLAKKVYLADKDDLSLKKLEPFTSFIEEDLK